MPARPPETDFYENPDNHELWRDLSRTFEDFVGDDETGERQGRFEQVLRDIQIKLHPEVARAA
jgi:hypothetical protein